MGPTSAQHSQQDGSTRANIGQHGADRDGERDNRDRRPSLGVRFRRRSQGSQPPPVWRMVLGCPVSQPPCKPLRWHALFVVVCLFVVYCVLLQHASFVVVCLSVVYCVLLRNVSHMLQKYESAHRKTVAFHIHKNTRRQGCPMSQAPRKPLFWHAWFVIVCLCVVYCVLARNVLHMQERHESAHHKTAAFHIHVKKHKEKRIRSFFLSSRSRSAVAVEVGLPETGSSSGFVLVIRNRLERKSHCRQIPASHHRVCG